MENESQLEGTDQLVECHWVRQRVRRRHWPGGAGLGCGFFVFADAFEDFAALCSEDLDLHRGVVALSDGFFDP